LHAPAAMHGADRARLEVLTSLLDGARTMVRELQENPLLARLLDVFMRMPEGDREAIVGVLEREVKTRLLSRDIADDLTKIELHPNPNARLYVRAIGPEDKADEVETLAFLRAVYSVQRGIDALDPSWRAMVVVALRQMDPSARERIDAFNRAMRVLLDEAAGGAPGAPAATAGPGAATAAARDVRRRRKT